MATHHITCPIHGSISFNDEEKKLIDHPYFQRLRNIKQLGLTYLVYPNATHSRFAHSIGVMHLAGKLCDAILGSNTNFESKTKNYILRVLRIAGLFHDLGHGPLSHFFDNCIGDTFLGDLDDDFKIDKNWFYTDTDHNNYHNARLEHEHISIALIKKILINDQELAQDISSMIFEHIKPSEQFSRELKIIEKHYSVERESNLKDIFKSLLSGELDADRLDYLQRDSLFSGVKISSIDIAHIIGSIKLNYTKENEFYIQIPPSAVSSIEQVLVSRRQMFNQVYLHRTSYIFGKMLESTLDYLNESNPIWDTKKIEDFVKLTDESFLNQIYEKTNASQHSANKNENQLIAYLFFNRIPLKRLTERFVTESDKEQMLSDLKSITSYQDAKLYSITPKEFTKLGRDGSKNKNSLIRIQVHKSQVSVPLNNFSEVFNSTLWRKNMIRIVVVENATQTATSIGLFQPENTFQKPKVS